MSYKDGGYYAKYKIERTDGKPFEDEADEFMVLCFTRDIHAFRAAMAYLESVRGENPEFAEGLAKALNKAKDKLAPF